MLIRVRPGAEPGAPAEVSTTPADPSFVIHNGARHQGEAALARHRAAVGQRLAHPDRRRRARVGRSGGGIVFRRRVPHQALYAAALMRASLQSAGHHRARRRARRRRRRAPKPGRAAAAAGAARVGAARHPAAQDQQGLRQRLRRARAGGGGRRGLRRRADGRQGRAPAARGDRRAGAAAAAATCRATARAWATPTASPPTRWRRCCARCTSIRASAPRSCSRCRWAASTAPRATGSRGRWPPSACAPRRARCTASRACRGWSATAPTCWRSRSWSKGSAGGTWPAVRGAQVGCVNAMMRYVYEADGSRPEADRSRAPARRPISRPAAPARARRRSPTGRRRAAGTAAQAHEDPIDAFLRKQRDNAAPRRAPIPAPPPPPALRIPPRGIW